MIESLKSQIWDKDSNAGRLGNYQDHCLSYTLEQVAGDLLPPAPQPRLPVMGATVASSRMNLSCLAPFIRLRVIGEGNQIG